jgi:hypothetical protein
VPDWKPELSSPKDVVAAIAVEWFCDEVFTAVERIDIVRYHQPQMFSIRRIPCSSLR